MKITSIDLYSSTNTLIATLSFKDPSSQNPYIAKSVVGLDADEITARFYGVAGNSKDKYYNLSLERRDVVIRIALNPQFSTQSYSDLRDSLYKMISASRTGKVDLRFNNGITPVAHVQGFISKFEASHFSETPEVQMTVECDDPVLRTLNSVNVTPIISPSELSVDLYSGLPSATILDDISTAPHGFKFEVLITQNAASFILQDGLIPEWIFKVTPGVIGGNSGFLVNDKLHFSSEYGDKYLLMDRGGEIIYLVDKITNDSIWPILFPGYNRFESSGGTFTWTSVTHYPSYWGI